MKNFTLSYWVRTQIKLLTAITSCLCVAPTYAHSGVASSPAPAAVVYCTPAATGTSDFINSFTTTLGITNINNTASGMSPGGYGDYTSMVLSQSEGSVVNFNAAFTGGTFGFSIWIDWDGNTTFETGERVFNTTAYATSASGTFIVPAGTPEGSYRMRILADYNSNNPVNSCGFNSGNGEAEDYTFDVVPPPVCPGPTALAVQNLTTAEAELTWTSSGTLFDIEYGPTGFTQGTGTLDMGVANPHSVSELSENTNYQFYVRRDCGTDGQSTWSGPFGFFTGYCRPTSGTSNFIKDFATTEGFSNITNLNSGVQTGGYSNHTSMVVSQSEGASVNFNAVFNSGTFGFAIWIDWNGNLAFEPDEKMFTSTAYATGSSGTFTVPGGTSEGSYTMRILADYNNSTPANPCGFSSGNGEAEDYTFEVTTPPVCPAPTTLAIQNLTTTEAELSWASSGTLFEVEYGPTGFTQGTGTIDTGVTNPHSISGLSENTNYQFYVRTDCGTDGQSTWSGPFGFYTGYCTPTSGTSYFINDFVTTGGFSNINNTASGVQTGGYSDHTSMILSQSEGGSIDFNAAFTGGTFGFSIWIDWNRNLTFDTDERMFNTTAYATTASGTFTVPTGTSEGNYTMRILADYNSTSPVNPCSFSSGNGEAEDYTFQVGPPPVCPAPTALGAQNLTTDGAELTWVSSGTLFDVEYGPAGFTQGTGTEETGATSPHSISGLSANTVYQFYVRRDCGTDGQSIWAGPFNFRTACGTQTVPYLLNFNEVTTPAIPTCTSIQNAGTGNNWKTDSVNGWGFASKLLNYSYNGSNPADAWFFTNGIQLEAGASYDLKFQYGNSGGTTYVERLKVNIGTSADYNEMATNIVDYPAIVNNTPLESITTFTVETSGVYYLGFNAYSITDRAQIYVDNISIDVSLSTPGFDASAFKAYPNPVKDMLNLSYVKNITDVSVFNLIGQQVIAKSVNSGNTNIDMSGLPSGTYLVKVAADNVIKTLKIIKQ